MTFTYTILLHLASKSRHTCAHDFAFRSFPAYPQINR